MSKRSNSNRDAVVMVGEVQGKSIQILQVDHTDPILYEWRVLDEEGKVYHPHNLYDTMDEAFAAAIEYLVPDAPEAQADEPTKDDYAALNAALYVGGAMEDIEDLQTAVGTFAAMGGGIETLRNNIVAVQDDLDAIEDILASSPRGDGVHVENIRKIADLHAAQTEVLIMVLERSRDVIAAFVQGFIRS